MKIRIVGIFVMTLMVATAGMNVVTSTGNVSWEENEGAYFDPGVEIRLLSNTITDNTSNIYNGIIRHSSNNNMIYNNYFHSTVNAQNNGNTGGNISKIASPHILAGHYYGGNDWGDYTSCDTDGGGLGDTRLLYDASGDLQKGEDRCSWCLRSTCPSGMIGLWKLDESTGPVVDSYNGNHGTNNGATRGVTGKVGDAFEFDGVDDYVSIPGNDSFAFGTGNFTLEAWIRYEGPTPSTYFPTILSNRPDKFHGFIFGLVYYPGEIDGCLFMQIAGINYIPCTTTVDDGDWHHVAVTRLGTALTFYVDGSIDGTANSSKNMSSSHALWMGDDPPEYGSGANEHAEWEGLLDEVAVYDACLCSTEIASHYDAGLVGQGYCDDVIWVDDDFDVSTPGWQVNRFNVIQDGVDAVSENGTVYVFSGVYYENVVINTSLSFLGESRNDTIIDGGSNGSVITVSSPLLAEILIDGFTIQNGEAAYGGGICCTSAFLALRDLVITNCHATSSGGGISWTVTGVGNYHTGRSNHDGIFVRDCDADGDGGGISIEEDRDGDYNVLEMNFTDSELENCSAGGNGGGISWTVTGVGNYHTGRSNNCNTIIDGCDADGDGGGIAVDEDRDGDNGLMEMNFTNCNVDSSNGSAINISGSGCHISIEGGTLASTAGYAFNAEGDDNNIIIKKVNASGSKGGFAIGGFSPAINNDKQFTTITIENCVVGNCGEDGIRLDSINDAVITFNTISENGNHGLYLNNSNSNTILYNNLINNTQNAYDNGDNTWSTAQGGNYWSDYTGNDTNGDGIGDTPYAIPGGGNVDAFPMMNPFISMDFYVGWNLITVPNTVTYTAETLGENITGCSVVVMFNASTQTFLTHVVGVPHDDFPIIEGVGYFVFCAKDSTLNMLDFSIPSVNVQIYEDWNMIGWYHEYSTTAESLGENISGTSVVSMFDPVTQTFMTHVVGVPHDNFAIERGMGLFIYTDETSMWQGEG